MHGPPRPPPDSALPSLSNDRSTILSLLDKSYRFSLDVSGIAGLLGGDDALSAIAAAHIYGNRRWLGWYNSPGSFQIAMRIDAFIKSASFRNTPRLPPGFPSSHSVHVDPMALLGLDSCKGPKFRAAGSDIMIQETSCAATLFMKACPAFSSEVRVIPGRCTQPFSVTVADLGSLPTSEMCPVRSSGFIPITHIIPIIVSFGTCALCAVCNDWYSSLRIFIGIVASSIFGSILGLADFVFTHPVPANESPVGDGLLCSDEDIVLLRGTEGAVNSITHGSFSLHLSRESHYNLIRLCSVLYFIQGVAQLFLIPQATLSGQVMLLASLVVSALYNAWLASSHKEQSLGRILFERVLGNPTVTKFAFGTHTTAVVFVLLVVQFRDSAELLNELLPEDTKVWRVWKATVLEWLRHPNDQSLQLGTILGDMNGFTQEEKASLELLYEDALAAYRGYTGFLRIDSV